MSIQHENLLDDDFVAPPDLNPCLLLIKPRPLSVQISTPLSDAIVQTAAKETKSLRSDVIRVKPEAK